MRVNRLLALVLFLLSSGLASAQTNPSTTMDAELMRVKANASIDRIRAEARSVFSPILGYAPETRHALLELAVEPVAVVRLADASGKPEDYARIVNGLSPAIRPAARQLADDPEVLAILRDNLVMTGLLGEVYSDDRKGVREILDRLAAGESKKESEVDADWSARLAANEKAVEELEVAVEAYRKEQAAAGKTVTVVEVRRMAGYAINGGTIVVYHAPRPGFAGWLLDHPVLYAWVWAELWHHHHSWHAWYDRRWFHRGWRWRSVSRRIERRVDRRRDRREDVRRDRRDDRRDDRGDRRDDRKDRRDDRVKPGVKPGARPGVSPGAKPGANRPKPSPRVKRGNRTPQERKSRVRQRHREAWNGGARRRRN